MKIESYSFGKIIINDKTYTNDVIIFPDRVKSDWWRKKGHELNLEDIEDVLEYNPEVLIVGKGAYNRMTVASEVKKALNDENIRLIAESTEKAVEIYNKLNKSKKVVAALHLTC